MSTIDYPVRTLLRYHSKDGETHDSALVLSGGEVIQVKRSSQTVKPQVFTNVEAWLASLPGHPSVEELEVVEPEEEKESVVKGRGKKGKKVGQVEEEKEETKQKGKGKGKKVKETKEALPSLLLIPLSRQIPSTYWTHHLYRMMREANPLLLKKADVIHAFNALVQLLLDNQAHVMSQTPCSRVRYRTGVDIDQNPKENPLRDMCNIRLNSINRNPDTGRLLLRYPYQFVNMHASSFLSAEELVLRDRIVETYRKWFVLVRDDIVPYMKKKDKEISNRDREDQIGKIVRRMEALQEHHDNEVKRRRALIEALEVSHEKALVMSRRLIAKLSKEMEEE